MGSLKKTVEMVTSQRSLVFLLLFIVGYHLSDGKSRYGRYQNYDKKCQLRLYAVPELRVSNDIIDSDIRVRRQRRNDKSLSTIGNCCWKLYTRKYFRGRQTNVAGNIKVRTLRRLGRGSRKIRSVKQYTSCEDMYNKTL